MGPGVLVPLGFFAMVATCCVGVPLARAYARRMDRSAGQPKVPPEVTDRLERMEQAIDSIAIEVERISEGQRFTTKLLSERGKESAVLPAAGNRDA
ncbi:MAG TPA: hypothetical protein VFW98_18225 [Gemmatimonadaceae bacterium]|nr:hypothetical protein [Gemmatimonadaceae bacterium]